jgi:ParB family transcriptional regulator, chromosome partitioning protein
VLPPPALPTTFPPRRLENLPLTGPGAVFTERQGRSGTSFAPENLADLISSIAACGLLEPVLVEEIPGPGGEMSYRLVFGERRLRAMLWGAAHMADNPNFAELTAQVCRGPLTEAQRRQWQVAENFARADLKPGELGEALLWQRCALLAERLEAAGSAVPALGPDEDPAGRYRMLEDLARDRPGIAAPWRDVLAAAGLTISPRRARAVTAAFRALPRDVAADMDEHEVTVSARLQVARLLGREDAAAEIWRAVRDRGRPDLVAAAAAAQAADPGLDAGEAAGRAIAVSATAAEARAARRAVRPAGQMIDPAVTEAVIAGLRNLGTLLRAGGYVDQYTAGSLRLLSLEVADDLAALWPLEEAV